MAEETPESSESLLESLLNSGLKELFNQPDIRSACLKELEGAGCRPPSNHLVFFCLRKALGGAASFGEGAIRSRLIAFMDTNPIISGFVSRLARLNRQARDRNDLKNLLLGEMPPAGQNEPQPDEAMSLDVITALYNRQAIAGLGDQFETLLAGLRDDLRADLETAFANFTEPNLTWSMQENAQSIADAIRYDSQKFEFIGRDREMDELHHFLGDCTIGGAHNRFKWLLITGEGGDGKTRLALEFVRALPAPWTGGRLTLDGLSKLLDEGRWTPRKPTLLVIDYPAQAPHKVGRLLAYLDQLAGKTDMPVRVLMMERTAAGDWMRDMLPGENPVVREHCFRRERYEKGWQIAPLHPAHVLEIMSRRFRDEGQEAPEIEPLLEALIRVDPRKARLSDGQILPIPRPLFGAAVAELALEHVQSGGEDLKDYLGGLDAESVFDRLIARDRDKRWKPIAKDRLEVHENLLALATMSLGLKRRDYAEIFRRSRDILGEFLPSPGPAGPTALSDDTLRMMGSPDPEDIIRPYEPDLLGQYYVLKRLDRLRAQGLGDDFLNAAYRLGTDNAAVFALRVARDFPAHFRHNNFLWPETVIDASAGYVLSGLAVDLANAFGEARSWSDLDALFGRLDGLRHAFRQNEDIALREAMAAFNASNPAGEAGDWDRVDAMLRRLDALRNAFPQNEDIALQEAMASFNVSSHAGEAGDRDRMDAMLRRLDALRNAFPQNEDIALQEATAAGNVSSDAGKAGNWDRVDTMLRRLDALRNAFPQNEDIALREAMAVVNVSSSAGEAGDRDRIDAMLRRLDALRNAFPQNEDIALREAMAAVNVSIDAGEAGDWDRIDAMLRRLDALRHTFPQNEDIAIAEAKAAFNLSTDAGNAGDWDRVGAMLRRLDALRHTFPQNEDIAIAEAKAAFNLSTHAGNAGDWDRIDAILRRLDALRNAFPQNEDIAFQEVMAAVNVSSRAGNAEDWHRVGTELRRLKSILKEFQASQALAGQAIRGATIAMIAGRSLPDTLDWQEWAGKTVIETLAHHHSALEPDEIRFANAVLKAAWKIFPDADWLQPVLAAAEDAGFDWGTVPDLLPPEDPEEA